MNLVFWLLVVTALTIIWFSLAFVFRPIGRFFFRFRMKQDKYDGITCGLFEADGGAWKIEAMTESLDGKSVYKMLYRIKGFNALVFDEYGLDKLQKLPIKIVAEKALGEYVYKGKTIRQWIDEILKQVKYDWIPCGEETNPKEDGDYLICFASGYEVIASFYNDAFREHGEPVCPVAWMPLPEPYKPEQSSWEEAVMQHFTRVE